MTLNKKLSNQLGSKSHLINGYPYLIVVFVNIFLYINYFTALLNIYRVLYRISCRLKIAWSVKLILTIRIFLINSLISGYKLSMTHRVLKFQRSKTNVTSNHEKNVPSRLSPQWLCRNSCIWPHNVPKCIRCLKAISHWGDAELNVTKGT